MRKPKIAIAERDPGLRWHVKQALLQRGYEVNEGARSPDLLELFHQRRAVDLFILNASFETVGDGLEVVKRIRHWNETFPIILLATQSSEELVIAALRAGVNDYFKYPFSTEELLVSIQHSLLKVYPQSCSVKNGRAANSKRSIQPAGNSSAALSPYKLRCTTTYIDEHLEHELSLVELAKVTQTSPFHFARLFKQATGKTPHQYVIMRRVEHAQRLLREPDLPLIQICHQLGFADQSHFTAVFRKHLAATPKSYRNHTDEQLLEEFS